MNDDVAAGDRARGDGLVGDVPFDDLDVLARRDVLAAPGGEIVRDADRLAAREQRFHDVGADEAGSARHDILGHENDASARERAVSAGKPAVGRPGTSFCAFW